ncbi:MAG: D-aminoacyl-tRNA deacylase [Acidimicrobiales bacterium]
MRAVVQRVTRASVTVDGDVVGAIDDGLCVLLGITEGDDREMVDKLADKLVKLRIFADHDDKMNLSVADIGGSILLISQFTLYGDARKGNRPSFITAARPEVAEPLIDACAERIRSLGTTVATGRFGADMDVEIHNDGPVTILIEL